MKLHFVFPRALLLIAFFTLSWIPTAPEAFAQDGLEPDGLPDRPIPYPVTPPPHFERAIEQGTRTDTGAPGPEYWTNTATYSIDATLEPETRTLSGSQTISYQNNSPDELGQLFLHLRQNLHSIGTVRNRTVEVTGGMQIEYLIVDGDTLREHAGRGMPGYRINSTVMRIELPEPLSAGEEVELEMAWRFMVPEQAPRMGVEGDEVYFLGYWYPQMAVYSDVGGWRAEPYLGNGEFFMGFAEYDVRITVPEGWLVSATGELSNQEEVLSEQVRERLARATETREVVRIVAEDEREPGVATRSSDNGTLTWHFQAEQVRDFAFGTSNRYVWDATRAEVGDSQPEATMIHALYRPEEAVWSRAAEFAQFALEHLSEHLAPYPWPHMSVVEGIIGGGMEYPMITLIGGGQSDQALFEVTYHEIAHMWFPMLVSQDEKAFTWMDEGPVSFMTNEGAADFFGMDAWNPALQNYYGLAGSGLEVEPMRHGDQYPVGSFARVIAGYSKPAVALHALRGLVGQERFQAALQEYVDRWAYKHPEPWDLFNTMNDVLGENLDWFWRGMFFETWALDHAVADVEETEDAVIVTIEDRGQLPMPAPVEVTYADGRTVVDRVPVSTWLSGARTATLEFEPGDVVRVRIDPDRFLPDVARHQNVWQEEDVEAN